MLLIGHRKQETFAETLFAAYLKGNIIPLTVGDLSLPEDGYFAPFDVSLLFIPVSVPGSFVSQPAAPESQANLVVLFSECVIAFHPGVRMCIFSPSAS